MKASDILADLQRIMGSLSPNPVAPENRGVARLQTSQWVSTGQMYRLIPDEKFWPEEAHRPRILMNEKDVAEVRKLFTGPFGPPSDQVLADICEQLFAEQGAKVKP